MSDADNAHVSVTVALNSSGVGVQGFGLIGVISYKTIETGLTGLYGNTAAMVTAGYAASSPEVLAASAIFSQSPRPPSVLIMKGTHAPTQRFVIGVSLVKNLVPYSVVASGEGVTTTTTTYTSDGTATNDEIANGLVAALNLVPGKNFTAAATGSAGSLVVTVTANAPGNWFALQVLDTSLLSNQQTHADSGIATDLAAVLAYDPSWYYFYNPYASDAQSVAAYTWAEANGRITLWDSCNSAAENTNISGSPTDAPYTWSIAGLKRSLPVYHRDPSAMAAARAMGRIAPLVPGKWDLAYKQLNALAFTRFTATQMANLDLRLTSYYKQNRGRSFVWEGKVSDSSYKFLDNVVVVDWLIDTMIAANFGVEVSRDKNAYTDKDIAQFEAASRGVLILAASDAHDAIDPGDPNDPTNLPPAVSFPRVADIDPSTRSLRQLPNGQFSARLQGAVHKIFLNGTLTF
jgi:hypothetical protein